MSRARLICLPHVIARLRLIVDVIADPIAVVEQHGSDGLVVVATADQVIDDIPNRLRAITAELPGLAVANEIVEIDLRPRLALGSAARLLLFRLVELGDDVVDQRVAIGENVRGFRQGVARDRDETLRLAVRLDRHPVRAGHRLLAVNLGAAGGQQNPQPGP